MAILIDRVYHYGNLVVSKAEYVPIAFSDHFSLVLHIRVPEQLSKLISPKSKPLFKSNPDVVTDSLFKARLEEAHKTWLEVKSFDLDVLTWWELMVKPGIKKLLIERGKEMAKEKRGRLNLLLLQ